MTGAAASRRSAIRATSGGSACASKARICRRPTSRAPVSASNGDIVEIVDAQTLVAGAADAESRAVPGA